MSRTGTRSSSNPPLPSIDPTVDTWRDHALCRRLVRIKVYTQREMYDLFFPTRSSDPRLVADAKAICASCPVRDQCLGEAIKFNQYRWGIQGGLTADDRRRLVSPKRRAYRTSSSTVTVTASPS